MRPGFLCGGGQSLTSQNQHATLNGPQMHRAALLFSAISLMLAASLSAYLASRAVEYLESETQAQVDRALLASGQTWATTRADGLLVHLTGLAPDEPARLRAIEIIGQVLDTRRLRDRTTVLQSSEIHKPRFSLEALRNVDRVSLIGLIPAREGRNAILSRAREIVDGGSVTDMLESAEYQLPDGWQRNLDFGLDSLAQLPRSKISVTPEEVSVTAVTESPEEKKLVEQLLSRNKPDGTRLVMDISAPRPVITPFHFRMTLEDGTADLVSCSADTRAARDRILRAVTRAGHKGKALCEIGLGVPTTDWDKAVVQSVDALAALGGGTLTFTDSDVSLVAADSASQDLFDRVIGKLENSLPDLFSLHAVLPPKILHDGGNAAVELPEFVATRSPEGLIQLRGRVPNALSKASIGVYATALFGEKNVYNQTRIDAELPDGWPARVLAALEGLSQLRHGAVVVQPDLVAIRGVGADPNVTSEVSRIFADRLGDARGYKISVRHDPKLIPKKDGVQAKLDARECEAQINAVLDTQQIVFAPSSTDIEAASQGVLDAIAEILRDCPDTAFEIEGHTDSQGSEDMNLALSQNRAEAVLNGLLARRVLISSLTARGFGETRPIADNSTEEGRAANRRIAFKLMNEDGDEDLAEAETAQDTTQVEGDNEQN